MNKRKILVIDDETQILRGKCIPRGIKRLRRVDLRQPILPTLLASLQRQPLFIEDLATYGEPRTDVEDGLIKSGVRSIVVAPLHYQEQTIGTLELSSPNSGDLTALHAPKLDEVLPLFSMAVKRSMDELDNRVQAFIKEQCTAIHPVVEWRFRKAVFDGLERQGAAPGAVPTEMEPIVFRDVHPLYAIADIRGSSTQRSWSIQADLLAQPLRCGFVVRFEFAAFNSIEPGTDLRADLGLPFVSIFEEP